MKKYNESKKNKYELIRKKLLDDASPKTVLIPLADDVIKIDRRTKRGKRQTSTDVIPSYQTRERELGQGTKTNYISKANTIHRIFTGLQQPSSPQPPYGRPIPSPVGPLLSLLRP